MAEHPAEAPRIGGAGERPGARDPGAGDRPHGLPELLGRGHEREPSQDLRRRRVHALALLATRAVLDVRLEHASPLVQRSLRPLGRHEAVELSAPSATVANEQGGRDGALQCLPQSGQAV